MPGIPYLNNDAVTVPVTLGFDGGRTVGYLVLEDALAAELLCGDNVFLSSAWTVEDGIRRVAIEVAIVPAGIA